MSLNLFFKRAAFLAALFISSKVFGVSSQKTEGYRDIILKAQTLILQKERAQALNLLNLAIRKESKNPIAIKELTQTVEEVSHTFLSDKAQQVFELALSWRQSDPKTAIQKLAEASSLEPDQASIALEQMRMWMAVGDCAKAYESAKKTLEENPYLSSLSLVFAQATVCNGKFNEYVNIKPNPVEKIEQVSWGMVQIEYLFKSGKFAEALSQLDSLEKLEPPFPETQYWKWKVSQELKMVSAIPAQKYLSNCKALSNRQIRNYSLDPYLCRRLTEVETFLKKTHN